MHALATTTDLAPRARHTRIEGRFAGYGGIANGGYLAGVLLEALGTPAVVTLTRPTPVDRDLRIVAPAPDAVELHHAGRLLARAVRDEGDFTPPDPVPVDLALAQRCSYLGFAHHPAPDCFVCGTKRWPGEGLRVFAGTTGRGRVAAAWLPDAALGDGAGAVDARLVAAALDCPGAWAIASVGKNHRVPMLLGTLRLRIVAPVRAGTPHVVVGEADGEAGRKRHARTAIYDAAGTLCAAAQAIWLRME